MFHRGRVFRSSPEKGRPASSGHSRLTQLSVTANTSANVSRIFLCRGLKPPSTPTLWAAARDAVAL